MFGAGQGHHSEPVRKGREVLLELVRRTAGRNEMDFVEIEAAIRSPRDSQMSGMNGIEGAAEKSNTPGMVFGCCAMGLGCGQSASIACRSSDSLTVPAALIHIAAAEKPLALFDFFVLFAGQLFAGLGQIFD
jgi:hypothetical protein